ncbi:collagen binding domain-containing protein [Lysinibacillus pakistanensis]
MKKLNLAIIILLLVFQTVLSPISVFADEGEPPVTPPTESTEDAGTGSDGEGDDPNVTSGDTAEVTVPEDEPTAAPLNVTPLNACVGPQELAGVTLTQFDMNIGGNAITEGVYTTPLPKDQKADFDVKFNVLLDDLYCAGSYFEFDLPASLIDFNSAFHGSKQVGNIAYSYTTVGNKVRVELTNNVEIDDVSTTTPAELTMNFQAGFNLISNDIEQELEIPKVGGGEAKTKFTFLPSTSNEKATKTATDGIPPVVDGNHQMEWTIWLNQAGKNFDSPSLVDNPTGGHAVVSGSVNVYEYEVDLMGVKMGTETQVVWDGDFSNIVFQDKHAYKIVYKTEVNLPVEQREGKKTFYNSVTFTNGGIPESVNNVPKDITYGKELEKAKIDAGTNNYTSKWEIRYNYNQASIPQASAIITDTLPGIHEIDTNTIEVRVMAIDDQGNGTGAGTIVDPSNYNVTPVTNGFELQFNNAIDKAYKVTYDAKYNGTGLGYYVGTNPTTVTNTVVSGTKNDSKPHTIKEGVLTKTHVVNFDTKEITWTIDIKADNPNEAINNLTLADVFKITGSKEGTHTLVGDESNITITGTTGAAPVKTVTDPTDGFTITGINIAAGGKATVTYKTSFAIGNDGEVQSGYGNTATVNWDSYTVQKEDHYTPATTTVNNGSKAGAFNYLDQLFTWKVKVNINKKDIQGAILTDTIGAGHEFVANSLKVYEYTLTTGDDTSGTPATTPIDASNYTLDVASDKKSYTLTFNNSLDSTINEKAYLVEYHTKDSDEILGIGIDETGYTTGNVYSNTATFQTLGSKNYTLEATPVTLPTHVANNLIKKTATQDNSKQTVSWTLDVNQSHSKLGANVTLEDTPSGNLMLIEGSIKVRKYNVTATSISQNGTGAYVDPSTYGITVNKKADGGFILHFANLNEGYQVQYQTIGLGKIGQGFSNDAKLTFGVEKASNQKDDAKVNANFTFSSSDTSFSMVKGDAQFKKVGVNSETGAEEPLSGVQFQLYKVIGTNNYLIQTATSGTDGLFSFTNINYGNYKIEEVAAKAPYQKMVAQLFTLDAAKDTKVGSNVVTKLVNVTPLPGGSCPTFNLTVKNIDGAPVANKQIELIDSNGAVKSTVTTGIDGKVAIPSTVQAGEYKVKDSDGIDYGKVIVKFGAGGCQGEVQPINSCPIFTITVNDEQNNPRPNVTVTLKNASNTVITTATTDGNGKITIPSTTPSGTYKLYEGTVFLGNVEVSYQNGKCEATITQAPTCEVFTLTVNDVDGKPRQGVTVEIKDKNNPNAIVPQPLSATDANGKVTIQNIKPGEYEVYENGTKIGEFTVDTGCEETVQPIPACSVFTLTVKDEDGILAEGTEVTITNTATKDSFTAIVGKNGKVTFPSATTPSGKFEVSITASGKVLDEFDVTYSGNCEDTAEKPRACDIFTITVKDTDGSLKGNTKVVIEDSNGNVVTTGQTDANGEIQLPQNQSPGMYTVYEETDSGVKGDEIGKVKVTYTDGCKGVVQKNACPVFTLTINDKNLKPVGANVLIVIKNQAGDVVTSGKTDASGKIVFEDKTKLQQGQNYVVFNEAGIKLGDITVSYADNICGATVQVPNNACPIFTLTVQDLYGYGRPNVAFTIKDLYHNTIASGKTNEQGVGTVPYTVQPGIYNVYEGNVLLGTITVTDGCSGLVKPSYTGGGGWIPPNPDPGKPVDPKPNPGKPGEPTDPTTNPGKPGKPTDPTTNPGKPGKPTDPTTNPGKPGEPTDPTTNPGEPGEPTDPTTNPGKPGEPTDPTTNPGKPGEPTDPTTNPGKPGEPTDPTTSPGKPGEPTNSNNSATPGKTEASKPSVQNVIDQGKKLPPYNPTKATKDTLDAYNDFLNKYSLLTKEEQKDVAESLDIDKIKTDAKRLEDQLKAQGKLPQTDGADQTALTLIGVALVLGALFFLRRRKAEIK